MNDELPAPEAFGFFASISIEVGLLAWALVLMPFGVYLPWWIFLPVALPAVWIGIFVAWLHRPHRHFSTWLYGRLKM